MVPPLNEYRVGAYDRVTQRIRRGLERLRKDLNLYVRKPTKKDLARLSGVHVNTLDMRSYSDSPVQSDQKTAAGWPLTELRLIQRQWKAARSAGNQSESTVESIPKGPNSDTAVDVAINQLSLESYQKQNIDLAYRNEQLSVETRELKRVNLSLRMELDRLSAENSQLKSAQMARSKGRSRVKVIK